MCNAEVDRAVSHATGMLSSGARTEWCRGMRQLAGCMVFGGRRHRVICACPSRPLHVGNHDSVAGGQFKLIKLWSTYVFSRMHGIQRWPVQ